MSTSLLIAAAVLTGLAIGLVPSLLDSLAQSLRQQLKTSERWVGALVAVFYLCWLPAMPLSGWLADQGRLKEVLFFGLLACALGIAWLGLSHSARWLLASVVVLGIGYSCVATAGIRLMPIALGFGSRPSTFASLNIGFVFISIGAVAGPWLAGAIQRRWGHRQGLLYLSLGVVMVAALVFLVPHDQFHSARADAAWPESLGDFRLWLIGVVILLYFAIENCLDVWPEPYLKELLFQGRGLFVAMLVFWGAFTLTRLGFGWLPRTGYHYEEWLLFGLLGLSACTMGNLIGAGGYGSGSLGVWLTGACYGPLLPGFLALVMEIFPGAPGTTLGIMLALSGLDTVIVRPAMNGLARRNPPRTVMRVPVVLALLMAAPLLVLLLTR